MVDFDSDATTCRFQRCIGDLRVLRSRRVMRVDNGSMKAHLLVMRDSWLQCCFGIVIMSCILLCSGCTDDAPLVSWTVEMRPSPAGVVAHIREPSVIVVFEGVRLSSGEEFRLSNPDVRQLVVSGIEYSMDAGAFSIQSENERKRIPSHISFQDKVAKHTIGDYSSKLLPAGSR